MTSSILKRQISRWRRAPVELTGRVQWPQLFWRRPAILSQANSAKRLGSGDRRLVVSRLLISRFSGCLLLAFELLHLASGQCSVGSDFDPVRLHLFGKLALEIDRQQAIRQMCPHDFDVIGKLETALKAAGSNA